jgi:proliferating cell nuclear antigen
MNVYKSNVLTMRTVQIAPFRTLITALKDILTDSNITFQADGMRILTMDKSQTVLVHLFLRAQNFEHYECTKEKIIIGVNMGHFHKLITSIDTDDTLTMYIEGCDYNEGVVNNLCLRFENGDIKQCKIQKLRLIEPDPEELVVPNVKFSSILHLPSADFSKIIRDLNAVSDKIEIKSVSNELIFKCVGSFATAEVRRAEADGSMAFVQHTEGTIIQGNFSLKNLGYFIKCTNLCNQIELYLENDMPLGVKYSVASLGDIKLWLAPLPDDNHPTQY